MRYEEWRKDKNWRYKSEHPLFEEICDIVAHIMHLDGPDKHVDGCNLITAFLLNEYDIKRKES